MALRIAIIRAVEIKSPPRALQPLDQTPPNEEAYPRQPLVRRSGPKNRNAAAAGCSGLLAAARSQAIPQIHRFARFERAASQAGQIADDGHKIIGGPAQFFSRRLRELGGKAWYLVGL